jgi:hypothetical protein
MHARAYKVLWCTIYMYYTRCTDPIPWMAIRLSMLMDPTPSEHIYIYI